MLKPVEITVSDDGRQMAWYDLLDIGLEGQAFADVQRPYDRLPVRARGMVTERVWDLSRQATGLRCRFETDADGIEARWWTGPESRPAHIPPTGFRGLDLYGRDDAGRWRWAGKAFAQDGVESRGTLFSHGVPTRREYQLYLPYRTSIQRLLLGVPAESTLEAATPSTLSPICFYGTSIVHGASAMRPGMTYPAIVSRRLDRPFFNFGFGGNGPLHLEMAELLRELDPAAFVLAGCENMTPELVAERAEPFVRILRDRHSDTPILLLEHLRYANGWIVPGRGEAYRQKNANLRVAYDRLVAAGDTNLHYLTTEQLIGDDDEATIDGTHPTDLGFMRMADAITPVLQSLL